MNDLRKKILEERRQIAESNPDELVGLLEPDARAVVKKMRTLVQRTTKSLLENYYRLGKLAIQLQEKTRNRHKYATGTMEKLADYIGVHPRTLYDCQRVAKQVPEENFRSMVRPHVAWGHVLVLLRMAKLDRLDNLEHWAEQISTERLTVDQLQEQFQASLPVPAAPDSAGRPYHRSKSLPMALKQLDKLVTTFQAKSKGEFFGDDYDIVQVIQDAPLDEFTAEMRKQIADTADGLDKISQDAAENAAAVRELLPFVDERIRSTEAQRRLQIEHEVSNTRRPTCLSQVLARERTVRAPGQPK